MVKRLGWVSLFTDSASEMIYPLLPAFLRSLGAGALALGWMEGVAESVSALVKWWAGARSDRSERLKPFVVAGYALAAFVRPLLSLAASPLQIVLIRATDRVGKGLRSAPRDALLTAAVPVERRGAAFGFHRMMDNTGAVIGPLLAFMLARSFGWSLRAIFAAALVPGLLALAVLSTVREGDASERTVKKEERSVLAAPLSLPVRRYLAVVLIFTLGASADSFLLLRMMDLGLRAAYVPLAWLSLSAAKAATNVAGGKISDHFGRRRTLAAAWVVYAAAYALFPLTKSLVFSWILLVAYGSYYGLAEGGEKAIVADLAQPSERGRAFGAFHAVTGLAVLPANLVFGSLYGAHPALAFGMGSAFALSAAIGLLALSRAKI
ncbi:MAG: MFS transporter [Polyangiaceae bacterium]